MAASKPRDLNFEQVHFKVVLGGDPNKCPDWEEFRDYKDDPSTVGNQRHRELVRFYCNICKTTKTIPA